MGVLGTRGLGNTAASRKSCKTLLRLESTGRFRYGMQKIEIFKIIELYNIETKF